jgi:hypothetical protein
MLKDHRTMTSVDDLALLEKAQALIEVERSLTSTMEKVEPYLTANTLKPRTGMGKRVRPIPTTMEQVNQVLAVSRIFASRTSAPAGWNTAAPVVGFTTPNPLPHQLRGGALAALQLEQAGQAELDRKRRREEEEEAKAANKKQEVSTSTTSAMDVESTSQPKLQDQSTRLQAQAQTQATTAAAVARPRRIIQQQVLTTTMNLSDSSSSEDDEDD